MADRSEPEVKPVDWRWLGAISLGAFLLIFLTSEAIDPRWIGLFRPPASPSPIPTMVGRAVRPVPTARARATSVAAAATASTLLPLASPESEPTPMALVVVFSGERGVRLRVGPSSLAQELEVLPEGTTVEWLGAESVSQGRRWLEVRVPSGASGWLPADLLAVRDPTRTP